MNEELERVYQQALELTRQQGLAIRAEQWDELLSLLERRDHYLGRAKTILTGQPLPANRVHLIGLIRQLQQCDQVNQTLFQQKRELLLKESQEVNQGQAALASYLSSLHYKSGEPDFVDHNF
ncbi:MAG: flagellar protein FliT [Cyanobacteria bacterium NC_groundwater_1444_Ag_S-0.65um_54_12]|nr:flagellar protein FliT [Cyanobacteria bacterium NC_groundwater_1444_Ag_S-0.65um_54_12]